MKLIKENDVSLMLGYDLEKKEVKGVIRLGKERVGIVVGKELYINSNCAEFKKVVEVCKNLKDEVADYNRMWEEHNEPK